MRNDNDNVESTSLKDVQVIAGHSSFSVTMDIYGLIRQGFNKEAAKKPVGISSIKIIAPVA
jgi:hypothetical protein